MPFDHWDLLSVCALGAIVSYCAGASRRAVPIQFVPHLLPKWQSDFAPVLDAVLFACVGALVAYVATQPATPPQALAAGFGWTGLLNIGIARGRRTK